MASGVTSRSAIPVPPVVTISSNLLRELNERLFDLVLIVNDGPLLRDIEAVLPQDFSRCRPGAIGTLASRHGVTDGNYGGGFA